MEEQISTSDNLNIIKLLEKPKKKVLLVRLGGIGDCVVLTVVAKHLHAKGYIVDYFVGSPSGKVSELFDNLPYINSCKNAVRVNNIDCIEDENKNFIAIEILKANYDEVFDYKFSIEHNHAGVNKPGDWRESINSNYFNWVDLSLAWANIDYTLVPGADKIPDIGYKDVEKYLEWYKTTGLLLKTERTNHKVIVIALSASSLVRTFYRANDLPDLLYKQHPDDIIVIFDSNSWFSLTKFGKRKIDFDDELNPLLQSVEIVKNADVFISADSGFSHIAASLRVKCVTLYTTVPSWTRAKYYIDQVNIDAEAPCRPCFTLGGHCPIRAKEALESLTPRERDLIDSNDRKVGIHDMAKKYQTIPQALNEEFKSAVGKLKALSAKVPACVESVTPELILKQVAEVLK